MKGTKQQRGRRKVAKALSDEYRYTRPGSRRVARRLLCATRFVACSLFLIFADAAHAFAETASANQVIEERLSGYEFALAVGILYYNFVIAGWVWLCRPRTTKRQRLVAVGLAVFLILLPYLWNKPSSDLAGSDFIFMNLMFLLFLVPLGAWLACIFDLLRSRSARSGLYFAVSGLLFVALFGWRAFASNFYVINLTEYSDGQPGVEAESSARPVEGAQ